jgi:hypothetical protein
VRNGTGGQIMSKENKIEEMASDIAQSGMLDSLSRCRIVAEELYFKGYRKQSENVIELPCYIGQEIWCVSEYYDGSFAIVKGKVSMLQQKADKSWKIRITVRSSVWDFTPNKIGESYFFSKEEAEAKMKGGAE